MVLRTDLTDGERIAYKAIYDKVSEALGERMEKSLRDVDVLRAEMEAVKAFVRQEVARLLTAVTKSLGARRGRVVKSIEYDRETGRPCRVIEEEAGQ